MSGQFLSRRPAWEFIPGVGTILLFIFRMSINWVLLVHDNSVMDFLTSCFNYSMSCNFWHLHLSLIRPGLHVCIPGANEEKYRTHELAICRLHMRTPYCRLRPHVHSVWWLITRVSEIWSLDNSIAIACLGCHNTIFPPLVMGVSTQTPHDPGCGIQYQKAQKCALQQFVLVQIFNLYLFMFCV